MDTATGLDFGKLLQQHITKYTPPLTFTQAPSPPPCSDLPPSQPPTLPPCLPSCLPPTSPVTNTKPHINPYDSDSSAATPVPSHQLRRDAAAQPQRSSLTDKLYSKAPEGYDDDDDDDDDDSLTPPRGRSKTPQPHDVSSVLLALSSSRNATWSPPPPSQEERDYERDYERHNSATKKGSSKAYARARTQSVGSAPMSSRALQDAQNATSALLPAAGFPQGWMFTVACRLADGKVRADKYWQGPDNRRYRSFKQIETANAGIQYCRDTFLKGVQAEINSLTNRMRAHDPTLVDTTPRAPTSRSRSNSLHTSHNSTPQPAPPRPVAPPSSSAAHAHGTRARSCSLPSSMLLNNNNNNSNKNNALPRSPAAASTASSVPYNADDHPLHLAPALLNTLVPHPKTIHGRCYVIRHPNRTPDTCLAFEFHPDPDLHPNDQQPRTVTEEAAWGAAIAVELIFQRNTGIPGQISTAQGKWSFARPTTWALPSTITTTSHPRPTITLAIRGFVLRIMAGAAHDTVTVKCLKWLGNPNKDEGKGGKRKRGNEQASGTPPFAVRRGEAVDLGAVTATFTKRTRNVQLLRDFVHGNETTAAISTPHSRLTDAVYAVGEDEGAGGSPDLISCFCRDDSLSPFRGVRSKYPELRDTKELAKPNKDRYPMGVFAANKWSSHPQPKKNELEAEWDKLSREEQECFEAASKTEKREYEQELVVYEEWCKIRSNKADSGGLCTIEMDPVTGNLHLLLSDLTLNVYDEVELFLDVGAVDCVFLDEASADDEFEFKGFSEDELLDAVALLEELGEAGGLSDLAHSKLLIATRALSEFLVVDEGGAEEGGATDVEAPSPVEFSAKLSADVTNLLKEVEKESTKRGANSVNSVSSGSEKMMDE